MATEERTCYRHPDRVTGLSCSECGRPICTECMTPAAVGLRCPEHSGKPQGIARVTQGVQRAAVQGTGAVTRALIAINVLVYVAELAQGAGLNAASGTIYSKGALIANGVECQGTLGGVPKGVLITGCPTHLIGVAHGEWWRLLTAAFLHYGPFHLAMNMWVLLIFGRLLEQRLGAGRFLLIYLASGLAGSAGALIAKPLVPTVGASGAIFGIVGAGLVLERRGDYVFGGSAMGFIIINLALSLAIPNISIGGHIGGLIGGALVMLGLSSLRRGGGVYGRLGLAGVGVPVLVGAASVVLAIWKARGYA